MSEEIAKPKRGRPRKVVADAAPAPKAKPSYKMKAKPNWEDIVDNSPGDETPDRLRIEPHMLPDGMAAQWVTDSVYGQPQPQHRAGFEKMGWTPVHQEDFDGLFDGMWMPKGAPGEIKVEGLVLMMRPKELSDKARKNDRRKAMEQVQIKERALRGGDNPRISLDPGHPSAVNTNRINKSIERIAIPED